MAPELLVHGYCTPAVDIYSFGVLLWEVCTGEHPVHGGSRPLRVPEECPQEVADLFEQVGFDGSCHTCTPPRLPFSSGRAPRCRPPLQHAVHRGLEDATPAKHVPKLRCCSARTATLSGAPLPGSWWRCCGI